MEKIRQELYDVYLKYKDFDFMNYYFEVSKNNTNNKYSKGLGFIAGLYEPSFVDEMRCSNASIGKEIKKIDKGYDYKYYFNENDRIILSEKYARILFEHQKESLNEEIEFNFEDFKQYENFDIVFNPELDDDTIIVENLKERFDASTGEWTPTGETESK